MAAHSIDLTTRLPFKLENTICSHWIQFQAIGFITDLSELPIEFNFGFKFETATDLMRLMTSFVWLLLIYWLNKIRKKKFDTKREMMIDLLVTPPVQFYYGRMDALFGDVRRRHPPARRPLQNIPRVLEDHRHLGRQAVPRTQTRRGGALLPPALLFIFGNIRQVSIQLD